MKLSEERYEEWKKVAYQLYRMNMITRLNLKQALAVGADSSHPESLEEFFKAEILKATDIRGR